MYDRSYPLPMRAVACCNGVASQGYLEKGPERRVCIWLAYAKRPIRSPIGRISRRSTQKQPSLIRSTRLKRVYEGVHDATAIRRFSGFGAEVDFLAFLFIAVRGGASSAMVWTPIWRSTSCRGHTGWEEGSSSRDFKIRCF